MARCYALCSMRTFLRQRSRATVCGLFLIYFGCAGNNPTTVLLQIDAIAAIDPDELRLTVYQDRGPVVDGRRVPATGRPTLPNSIVLFPKDDQGLVRLLVRASRSGERIAEGATVATLVAHAQVVATIVLGAEAAPDGDKDGVPDVVDNCPARSNPQQRPCLADAGAASDGGPSDADASSDDAKIGLVDSGPTPADFGTPKRDAPAPSLDVSPPAPDLARTRPDARRRAPDAAHRVTDAALARPDLTLAASDAGPPAVTVSNLSAQWATPNVIRWQWDSAGVPSGLKGFELVIGRSEQDVVSRAASTTILNASNTPHFGAYSLPDDTAVRSLITTDHPPSTQLFAQLTATDTANRRSSTLVVSVRTAAPPSGLAVIFADTGPPGVAQPNSYSRVTRAPYSTTSHHFEYRVDCPGTEEACFTNLQWTGTGTDLSTMPASAVSTAYLELALALDASAASHFSQAYLSFGSGTEFYFFRPFVMQTGQEYRLLQWPLRELSLRGCQTGPRCAPTHATLVMGVNTCAVGASWFDGATVRVDEARIRW